MIFGIFTSQWWGLSVSSTFNCTYGSIMLVCLQLWKFVQWDLKRITQIWERKNVQFRSMALTQSAWLFYFVFTCVVYFDKQTGGLLLEICLLTSKILFASFPGLAPCENYKKIIFNSFLEKMEVVFWGVYSLLTTKSK